MEYISKISGLSFIIAEYYDKDKTNCKYPTGKLMVEYRQITFHYQTLI